jgi:leucyl-tRNA synthetase
LTEEIYARLGGGQMLANGVWPDYDPGALVRNEIELVVQVNGKLRDRLMVARDADEESVKTAAFDSPRIKEHLEGKTVRKVIHVPGKLLNIVAG